MRLREALRIISIEFRAEKSRGRRVSFPSHATGWAKRPLVWPESTLRDTATITVSRT